MAYNPYHLLIARNGPLRSPAQPHITAGPSNSQRVFPAHQRTISSTSLPVNTYQDHTNDGRGEYDETGSRDMVSVPDIEIHETFKRDGNAMPGTVLVTVEGVDFWLHREIMFFGSPFFAEALTGGWAETSLRPLSYDSTRTAKLLRDNPFISISTPLSSNNMLFPQEETPSSMSSDSDIYQKGGSGTRSILEQVDTTDFDADSHNTDAEHDHDHDYELEDNQESHDIEPNQNAGPSRSRRQKASVYLDAEDGLAIGHEAETIAGGLGTLRMVDGDDGESSEDKEAYHEEEVHHAESLPSSSTFKPVDIPINKNTSTLTILNRVRTQSSPVLPSTDNHSAPSGLFSCGAPLPDVSNHADDINRQRLNVNAERGNGTGVGKVDARIKLEEVEADSFQDFLFWIYPHLTCVITWKNVEGLISLSERFETPSLRDACSTFLITHVAGKPMRALYIAEVFRFGELYREASRFVLDNMGSHEGYEWETLEKDTIIKLEKKKSWFLERLLKLQMISVYRDYQCCPVCPDPGACARILDERWRQAFTSVMRFGSPQPSIVFRYLRQLETTPPLAMAHTACQSAAKAWVASLFDRSRWGRI